MLEVPSLSDVRVELNTFTGGVLFDDGLATRTLVASNFDETGLALVGFILDADWEGGACHMLRVFQGDDLVGVR